MFPSSLTRSLSLLSLLAAGSSLLAACAGNKLHIDHNEEFGATDVFSHSFAGADKASCEAARRALLSQGYVISDAKSSFIKGRRKFQPESDVHVEIEFSVVCASDSKGSNSTTVFANAVRDRYTLKKSSTSASIGVGGIGSVSLPFGASDDSLVKVASETIPTGKFYDRFFQLVERYLDDSSVGNEDEEEDEKKAVLPSTAPAQLTQAVKPAESTP
jgi:Uncharacterized protein conserved in bacteria (DUF2242)